MLSSLSGSSKWPCQPGQILLESTVLLVMLVFMKEAQQQRLQQQQVATSRSHGIITSLVLLSIWRGCNRCIRRETSKMRVRYNFTPTTTSRHKQQRQQQGRF
jgi:hypothetical protein